MKYTSKQSTELARTTPYFLEFSKVDVIACRRSQLINPLFELLKRNIYFIGVACLDNFLLDNILKIWFWAKLNKNSENIRCTIPSWVFPFLYFRSCCLLYLLNLQIFFCCLGRKYFWRAILLWIRGQILFFKLNAMILVDLLCLLHFC